MLPSQLYLDHSHCPVLAPGRADLHILAALSSTRAILDRDVFYVTHPIHSIVEIQLRFTRPSTARRAVCCKLVMRISPLVFDREFSRFKTQIRETSNGREFTSFHEGVAADGESYKEHVRNEAIHRLQMSTWKRTDIGTGKILKRVIDAIEINEHPRHLRNNLVAWPNRYGHAGRSHSAFLDAQTDALARRKFEQWFFDLFRGARSDEMLFESFRELVGSRYDLIAYLFFLKD
jgi:hypothetical protein